MSNGKVRPAWMGGTQEEQANGTMRTAPAEGAPPEARPESEPEQEPEHDARPLSLDRAEHISEQDVPTQDYRNARPSADYEGSVTNTDSTAFPSGENNVEGVSGDADHTTRASGAAPAGVKATISSFVERISGKHLAPWGAPAPGGGEEAPGSKTESPEEIEREVMRSLRDTGIEGFCRLAFGSPKGGVGKSSIAYAVAGAIAYFTNLRVCLVDCDPDFGATRYMVPRPLDYSVLDLAEDADSLSRLADLRGYVSQNKHMGLDILLNPVEAAQISNVDNLADAYERVDSVLSQFYDLVVFDLGSGFRDPAIRRLLELSDELVLVSDSEKVPNAQLPDALNYVEGLGIDLSRTTLCINHGRRPSEESEDTAELRKKHSQRLRSITEVEYDPDFSRLLNDREFHPANLALMTRLGVLTTAGVGLQGLRRDAYSRAREKVISLGAQNGDRAKDSQNGRR